MDKSTKYYLKALNKYNDGYINMAFELCNKSIALNNRNSSALNLKGMLYYLTGKLSEAQGIWQLNYKMNKNDIARKYLQDSKNDKDMENGYKRSLELIKDLRIDEAKEMLIKCLDSDFNTINVNNAIANCYIKLGEYDNAYNHVNKTVSVDRKNAGARQILKILKSFGGIKKSTGYNYKKIITAATLVIAAAVIIYAASSQGFLNNNKISKENSKNTNKKTSIVNNTNKQTETSTAEIKSTDTKDKVNALFPYGQLENSINSSDYNIMYDIYQSWKDKDLSINNKVLLNNALNTLKKYGTESFYNNGSTYLKNKKYKESINEFSKAYSVGKESYLYPHIIYFLALSYEESNDIEMALKYYTIYHETYRGDYEETVLYKLSVIYNGVDNTKGKGYAEQLVKNYPNSIYNNSNIKQIIDNQ
ncbi:MAG: repeat-containing protein [Clostridiaceae bacterium]|nr:repeat-containing protein [Clostridiaceae bacterium]